MGKSYFIVLNRSLQGVFTMIHVRIMWTLFFYQVRHAGSQWKQVFTWWYLEQSTTSLQRYTQASCIVICSFFLLSLLCRHSLCSQHNSSKIFFLLAAVNCPLPKILRDGRIIHDKPVTGTTVMYGHGWTYECNPPKAPSYERGTCMADGTATEPPVCQGMQMTLLTIPSPFVYFSPSWLQAK